jgi:hypothetical protein
VYKERRKGKREGEALSKAINSKKKKKKKINKNHISGSSLIFKIQTETKTKPLNTNLAHAVEMTTIRTSPHLHVCPGTHTLHKGMNH